MNKKNLDKLFQEKLKDYRETPDEQVWQSIQNSLDEKKKSRRVIPIWWKLGGAAAVLLIALFLINPFDSPEVDGSVITDTENTQNPDSDETIDQDDDLIEQDDIPESSVVQTDQEDSPSSDDEIGDTTNKVLTPAAEAITSNENRRQTNDALKEEITQKRTDQPVTDELIKQEEAVAADQNKEPSVEDTEKAPEALITGNINQNDVQKPSENQINETTVAEEIIDQKEVEESGKKSIFDEIKKQEEEKEALAESSSPKWSVGPSVAPVYFNSFGEGSPIHSNFVSNSKSGNVNLSYGVGVAYEISKKLSVRSGLHRVDYGYNTDDITFSSSLVASTSTQITNINYTNTSRNLVVESSSNPVPSDEFVANDIIAQSPSRSGRMVQEFGYIEVPMELNYSLMDRKFNIDIIGGVSSLFLVNNSVILESAGSSTEMGEANNLNDVNFSTNVGLGINYELTDKMKVHLEPMFKYQLNTFSDTEGNFQPYSLGIYTGMSFKF